MTIIQIAFGVETLEVMNVGIGSQESSLISNANKDPPSSFCTRANKIHGSESPVVDQ